MGGGEARSVQPKTKCCTPGCFLPGLLCCPSIRAWVAETVEARAGTVDLVNVRLNDPVISIAACLLVASRGQHDEYGTI